MRSSTSNPLIVASFSVLTVLCIASGPMLHALSGQQQKGATTPLGSPVPMDSEKAADRGAEGEAHMHHVQEALAMDERHKKMQSDADKLLQLATDLKAEVEHSSKNETSVSAFLKADQIEKLAHDVKQRLKN